jgi:hypothetical protein
MSRVFPEDNNQLVTFQTAPALIEMFDACYKNGVIQARQLDDEGEAQDFIDQYSEGEEFAILCDVDMFGRVKPGPFELKLVQWRRKLMYWTQTASKRLLVIEFLNSVPKLGNFAGVAYIVAKKFYLQGIYHYINNPTNDLEVFVNTRNAVLQRHAKAARTRKVRTTNDWIQEIQMFCADSMAEELREESDNCSFERYNTFARVFARCIVGRRTSMSEKYKDTDLKKLILNGEDVYGLTKRRCT